jgi:excinuclease ABC subunit C
MNLDEVALTQARLTQKLESLSTQPGCYLFRDREHRVLYVGKAKSLRTRVRSYFLDGSSDTRPFIALLANLLWDIETIVTRTEKEALILEHSLVREHKPRFNVKLRDDKNFLSLRLAIAESFPRLVAVRRAESDGARYFGPYHSATAARRTLSLVNKHFQLRTCTDTDMRSRKRPCLQYQIKRCLGPCVFPVDAGRYQEQVQTVSLFLEGRHDELSALLGERMRASSTEMQFEVAAVYRDQLRAIDSIRQSQRVISQDGVDRDVFGFYLEGDRMEIAVLYIRMGRLQDVLTSSVKDVMVGPEEVLSAFLARHYGLADAEQGAAPIPQEVVLPTAIEPEDLLAELLGERAGRKVLLTVPQRGKKTDLLELAEANAKQAFEEKRKRSSDLEERLGQLQQKLRLEELPTRIECCDISHLGGQDSVGAVVAMKGGTLDKSRYRIFHVKNAHHTAGDDYGAMYEVLSRRFRRARDDADWEPPQLFVVDGGRGQLQVALAAARDLGLHGLAIVGLAKEKENVAGEMLVDRVYLPGQKNPIALRSSSALMLLAQLRDEAHRFSNRAREKVGRAKRFSSALDDIPGIGPKTKTALLQAFGSVEQIKRATDAALLAVPGVNPKRLQALRDALGPTVLVEGKGVNKVDVELSTLFPDGASEP